MHSRPAAPDALEPLHTPGSELRATCERLGREAFVAAHPHPWLVQDLKVLADMATSVSTAVETGGTPGPDPERLRRLYLAPHQFGAVPLVKSRRNPWAGRLMVGRARTNDVVLLHPSVSKVHARLLPGADGAAWMLADTSSTNGTWVDGRLLEPEDTPVPLLSPCTLKLGSVVCLLLSSAQLFDALRPPTAR